MKYLFRNFENKEDIDIKTFREPVTDSDCIEIQSDVRTDEEHMEAGGDGDLIFFCWPKSENGGTRPTKKEQSCSIILLRPDGTNSANYDLITRTNYDPCTVLPKAIKKEKEKKKEEKSTNQ